MRPFCLSLALALGLLAGAGCGGPCEALAEKVCSCEPNQTEEDACLIGVERASDRVVTMMEEVVCEQKLDTCTCAALEREELDACGLTNESPE